MSSWLRRLGAAIRQEVSALQSTALPVPEREISSPSGLVR